MPTPPKGPLLTNHALVLLVIRREPHLAQREIAARVGITENAVQRIVNDLEAGGYLESYREGRHKRYAIQLDAPLRPQHSMVGEATLGEFLRLLTKRRRPRSV